MWGAVARKPLNTCPKPRLPKRLASGSPLPSPALMVVCAEVTSHHQDPMSGLSRNTSLPRSPSASNSLEL